MCNLFQKETLSTKTKVKPSCVLTKKINKYKPYGFIKVQQLIDHQPYPYLDYYLTLWINFIFKSYINKIKIITKMDYKNDVHSDDDFDSYSDNYQQSNSGQSQNQQFNTSQGRLANPAGLSKAELRKVRNFLKFVFFKKRNIFKKKK